MTTEAAPELPTGPGDDAGDAVRYMSHQEFADRVGLNRKTLYDLRRRDGGRWVIDPDVMVEDVAGWTEERVVAWGKETGRLNEDGTVSPSRGGRRRMGAPPRHWRRKPVRFLNRTECGALLGHESHVGVYFMRRRGSFIDPAVMIGNVPGWRKEDVLKFGRRTGRLNPDDTPKRRE